MIKVSVVIPTYNSSRTIHRAILSVLRQTGINKLFEVEILICDDCSTDSTLLDCMGWDANLRIFQRETNSGGPNWGRNKGIKESTGGLIAFLDHDDQWLPDKLKNQIKEINNGYEFVYSGSIKGV